MYSCLCVFCSLKLQLVTFANKLMLAVPRDSRFISFVVALSFKSGLNPRQNGCRESCSQVQANQLIQTLPVAKKRRADRPVSTESTESFTDCANRTGVIEFLPILNTEAWWENTEISRYPPTQRILTAVYGYYDIFSKQNTKKVIIVYPKATKCSFNWIGLESNTCAQMSL